MTKTQLISPFSLNQHQWRLKWKRISSRDLSKRRSGPVYETNSRKERKALEAMATVGLIEGKQLQKLFKLSKTQIRKMEHFQLITKHSIKKNNQEVSLYTLGIASVEKIAPEFVPNYWVEYNTEDVLSRFMFFQLYDLFKPLKAKIIAAPTPFIGALELNGNPFYIYCTRGDTKDLQMLFKWKSFSERIIIITEQIQHLKPLDVFLQKKQFKIRAITDEQMVRENPRFYTYRENEHKIYEWILESSGKR